MTTMGSRRRGAWPVALVSLAVLCACGTPSTGDGTSGGDSQFSGPYAAEFKDALQYEKNPESRAAIADGKITRAEYEDAFQRFKACVADQGFTVDVTDDGYGFYQTSGSASPGAEAAYDKCSPITDNVEFLYAETTTNPTNEDPDALMVRCLKAQGLVDASYTVERYEAELEASGYVFNGDGEQISKPRNSGASTSPVNLDDPKVRDCHGNAQTVLKGK